jgi:D-alanine--poly(phosphoribitol) ligase subunit 1
MLASATNLWDAFVGVATDDPAATALIVSEECVTFGRLRELAEYTAGQLASHGVGTTDVVALQLPKRVFTYALMLACLRLGVPYVLLDPLNPPERTSRILGLVRPRLLLSTRETDNPYGTSFSISSAESAPLEILGAPVRLPESAGGATGTDPAYIMFTSGSTGEPKGAIIPHQGVMSLIQWARKSICSLRSERFTAINPLHFDNSVFDFYCGLWNGATLVPVETAEASTPVAWVRAIRIAEASVMFAVPTMFLILDRLGLLTPASLPSVRTFIFGGEGYPIGQMREFYSRFEGRARLINVYGPTETSCISTSIEIDRQCLDGPDDTFPPLGRMHENFSHAILDENQTAVGKGSVGELWIGGPCVGLGYFANPSETAARFRQDPRQQSYRAIFYRSGDLVREDSEGRLWFHGRVDNQIKIRGHRIELEEIDLAVQCIPGVRRAVSVALPAQDGSELNVAFVADRTVPTEEVYEMCRRRLPAYMQPARVFQLDDLPQNANGKIDRRATSVLIRQMG